MKLKFVSFYLFSVITTFTLAVDATWNVNNDGNWVDAANWNPTTVAGAATGTTNSETATFGAIINAARTVTVDASRNVASINFAGNSSAYTLSGGSLTLSSGGTMQTTGAGSGHTDEVATPITLANASGGTNGVYSILSGSSTSTRLIKVSGAVTGSATDGTSLLMLGGNNTGNNTLSGLVSDGSGGGKLAVEKIGSGVWLLGYATAPGTNNTFSGGLTIHEGEVRLLSTNGAKPASTGSILLGTTSGSAAATLRIDNSFSPANTLTVAAGSTGIKTLTTGNIASPGYTGQITLNDGLTIMMTNTGTSNTNFTLGGSTTLHLHSNTLTLSLAHGGSASNTNNSTITVNKIIEGSGAVKMAASGLSTGTRTVNLAGNNTYAGGTTIGGSNTNKNIVVNVANDQSMAKGGWTIDTDSGAATVASTVNFNANSLLAVAADKAITLGSAAGGHFGARTLNADGTITNDGSLFIRRASSVNVNGAWIQNGAAAVTTVGGGLAALKISFGASFIYTAASPFELKTSISENIVTNLDINGGTFTTGVSIHNDQDALSPLNTAFSQVLLNDGGTMKLSSHVSQLLTTKGGNIRVLLGSMGDAAIIDTNGYDTEINQPIGNITSQIGRLTKAGLGTLTLSGALSYSGDTTVAKGVLSLTSAALHDGSHVTVNTGATLNLNFSGTDVVSAITLGGTDLAEGTYSAITHPSLLTGTGKLQILPADPYLTWIEEFYTGQTNLAVIGRDADPDGDGVANVIEYLTGGLPDDPTSKGQLWIGVNDQQLIISLAVRGESTTFNASPSPSAVVGINAITIQGSTTLTTFDSPVSATPLFLPPGWPATAPVGFSYHSFKLNASSGLPDRGFLRVIAP